MTRRLSPWVYSGMLVLAAMAAPAWADLKVGTVNYTRLMQESPQAKAVQDALRAEFGGRQKELQAEQASLKAKEDALQKDGPTMSADDVARIQKELRDGNRDMQQKLTEFQDDVNQRQNEELSKLNKLLVDEVQNYAQNQSYDLILADGVGDGVLFAGKPLDITPQILGALLAHSATRPPAAAASGATPAAAPKAPSTPSGK